MHFSIDRTVHTTAFDKPVVYHWLERKMGECEMHFVSYLGKRKKPKNPEFSLISLFTLGLAEYPNDVQCYSCHILKPHLLPQALILLHSPPIPRAPLIPESPTIPQEPPLPQAPHISRTSLSLKPLPSLIPTFPHTKPSFNTTLLHSHHH